MKKNKGSPSGSLNKIKTSIMYIVIISFFLHKVYSAEPKNNLDMCQLKF